MGRFLKLAIAAVSLGAFALPAFADMKAFNAAVKAGDYKTAAAEAKATWPTWNKADPDTAIVAREFGFAALVAGDNEQARDLATFLMDKGATLAKPDDQPLTSTVLFRVADFKIRKTDRERTALRNALQARIGAPGVDMTSTLSWEALYVADWNAADWVNAVADATAAGEFLAREKSMLVGQRKAEVHAVASVFVGSRSRITQGRNELYDRIADVHDRIVSDLDEAKSEGLRAQLWPVKWKAEAWAIAVESFINSSYQQVGSNIPTRLNPRQLQSPKSGQYAEPVGAKPLCAGQFDGPKLVYPESSKFHGVGAMVVRLETGPDGKVTTVEILAAIPDEKFVENLVKTMRAWTYKPNPGVDTASCRLNSRSFLQKGSFRMM